MNKDDFFTIDDELIKDLFEKENIWETVKDLSSFLEELYSSGKIKPTQGNNVYIAPDAKVDETARIEGPAYISSGAEIRFNAYIRSNVFVGKNSVIGHGCEIKNSVILDNTKIAHFNHIGDSLIGSNVNIAGGAQVANLRLDRNNVSVDVNSQKVDTGLKKLGAIIGDGCEVGINAAINPGTILGKKSIIFPLTSVSGTYEANSTIK